MQYRPGSSEHHKCMRINARARLNKYACSSAKASHCPCRPSRLSSHVSWPFWGSAGWTLHVYKVIIILIPTTVLMDINHALYLCVWMCASLFSFLSQMKIIYGKLMVRMPNEWHEYGKRFWFSSRFVSAMAFVLGQVIPHMSPFYEFFFFVFFVAVSYHEPRKGLLTIVSLVIISSLFQLKIQSVSGCLKLD